MARGCGRPRRSSAAAWLWSPPATRGDLRYAFTENLRGVDLCLIMDQVGEPITCPIHEGDGTPEQVRADFAVLAELSRGLNTIYAGSTDSNPERWEVSQAMIEAEIKKARKANAEHDVKSRKEQNGF